MEALPILHEFSWNSPLFLRHVLFFLIQWILFHIFPFPCILINLNPIRHSKCSSKFCVLLWLNICIYNTTHNLQKEWRICFNYSTLLNSMKPFPFYCLSLLDPNRWGHQCQLPVPSRAQYLLLRFDFKSFIEDLSSQPLKMWAISKLTVTFHVVNDVPALRVERVPPCWILYLINSEPYIASCPRNSRLLL